jgi:hypothetical protein
MEKGENETDDGRFTGVNNSVHSYSFLVCAAIVAAIWSNSPINLREIIFVVYALLTFI